MSDVLHRLVSKALGTPNTGARLAPRPDWQLLSNAAPEPEASDLQIEDVPAPVPGGPGVLHSLPGDPALSREAPVAAPRLMSAHIVPSQNPSAPTAPRITQPEVSPTPSPSPPVSMRAESRHSLRRHDLTATSAVAPQSLPRDVSRVAIAAAAPTPAAPVIVAAPGASAILAPRPATMSGIEETRSTFRPVVPSVDVVPRATLEPSSTREEIAPPSRLKAHAATLTAQRAEAPAVHVTIGRLEIRAPHAAAPPARVQAPRAQTLDEYLSKRARESAR